MIEPCAETGCLEPAVGFGRWEGRGRLVNTYPKQPRRCRPHHLEAIAGQIVRCEVTGPFEIVDVRTGEDIGTGGMVDLDPAETNILVLTSQRLVRVIEGERPEAGHAPRSIVAAPAATVVKQRPAPDLQA